MILCNDAEWKGKYMQRFNVLCSVTAMASVLLNVGASGFSQTQETTAGTGKTVTVAADGSGDFKTVQEAINAAPTDKTKHFVIHIKPGTYKEKLTVPKGRGPITFLGDEARTTVLTYDDYAGRLDAAGKELGTGGSYSVKIDSDDFIAVPFQTLSEGYILYWSAFSLINSSKSLW